LEPALPLSPGPFHTAPGAPLFGPIGDSAPDRWGRALMRRAERRRARQAGEALRRQGARAKGDIQQLWRRIVFTILISNTDDHLRNHGFLYAGPDGWTLSPAYDLNPVPADVGPRVLSNAIDLDDPSASLELAFSVAEYFELSSREARAVAAKVADVVAGWRSEAARLGITRGQQERMASAFEHDDLQAALW